MTPYGPTLRGAGRHAVEAVRRAAIPLTGSPADFDPIVESVGERRLVLLGEASHGTHDFYRVRAQVTKRLVEEKGFAAVAIEGDWPDASRVHRYVMARGDDHDAEEALRGFRRFPEWMWRNADVLDFVGWLRSRNEGVPARDRCGFFGLDLYSLSASMDAVLRYLEKVDPTALARARERYACFREFDDDAHAYARAAAFAMGPTCEAEVAAQLVELRRAAARYALRDGRFTPDDHFEATQNAELVRDAEEYYRTMFRGRVSSWNLRDAHMADSLAAVLKHLESTRGRPAKVVVWAHNSHLGDARATEMGASGEWNLGQLVRERYPGLTYHVGFSTFAGTVTAAHDWGLPGRRYAVRPGLAGSYESVFHDAAVPNFLLRTTAGGHPVAPEPLLQRAIGVVYRPDTERQSHYFESHLSKQFDVVLHYDETRAVEPLERTEEWEAAEPAETYPSGL